MSPDRHLLPKTNLRLEPELRELLDSEAKKNGVPLTAEIHRRLWLSFDREKEVKEAALAAMRGQIFLEVPSNPLHQSA